ncbi:hypothetical protein D5018_02040 [Parashewanella curva]|uniref:Uncharacterized protein n=1 Tax=Parashewanella curva TaxID=2338552 RepID=A0A3L8Q0X1_9GAMM|nr:hypothetical protein [Parashewanella curva]RLV61281.1 hypothetical protein D5018_02040 [Parashewanella curva]
MVTSVRSGIAPCERAVELEPRKRREANSGFFVEGKDYFIENLLDEDKEQGSNKQSQQEFGGFHESLEQGEPSFCQALKQGFSIKRLSDGFIAKALKRLIRI